MPHANFRCVFNTIFWIFLTGARWKDVPENPNFASKSTAHRWLQRWKKEGVFDQMLVYLIRKAQEKELTACQRLIVDGSFFPC